MGKYHKKVKILNDAYQLIDNGLTLIELNVEHKGDMETYLWRFEKAFKELNRQILKELKKENLDEEFKRITKGF
jgi:hypothetical protein